MAKLQIEITGNWHHEDNVATESYVVEGDKREIEILVGETIDHLNEANEDRARFSFSVAEFQEPKILNSAELTETIRVDWL
jgi:hypothetical protein